jgi:hypothetical protein
LGTTRGDISTAEAKWKEIHTALYQSGLDALGKKEHKNEDWFDENLEEMEPAEEAERAEYLAHVNNPCPASKNALRAARNQCQQIARRCANNYWLQLSQRIQADADHDNTGGMYAGIKQAHLPPRVSC